MYHMTQIQEYLPAKIYHQPELGLYSCCDR
jgi:hypothetical protein